MKALLKDVAGHKLLHPLLVVLSYHLKFFPNEWCDAHSTHKSVPVSIPKLKHTKRWEGIEQMAKQHTA